MSFSVAWLRQREPYDHQARDRALVAALDAWLPPGPVHLVDLGCGLGSNHRFVAPRLDREQRWTWVDQDPALLAHAPADVEVVQADLRDGDWPVGDVLTTQALLDLVSEPWLEQLARHLETHRLPLLASLTVDGRVSLHPSDPDDEQVLGWFRAHQLTDRGFGASPGPRAASWLAGRLSRSHDVRLVEADWRIPSTDAAMVEVMVDGLAHAAAEVGDAARVEAWRMRRRAQLPALRVGHLDLLALPAT